MNKRYFLALLVATSATLAAPAFASGYGPAPHYRPDDGAPASQRGVSAQTVAAERASQDKAAQDPVIQANETKSAPVAQAQQ